MESNVFTGKKLSTGREEGKTMMPRTVEKNGVSTI